MKSKASKRPAKKKPVKKAAPKAPAKKALPVENQEKQAETKQPEAKDGSDRVHTKGGKVVDVVKQDTLKKKPEKPVSSSAVSVKSQKTPKADTKPVERQQKPVKTVERSRENTSDVKGDGKEAGSVQKTYKAGQKPNKKEGLRERQARFLQALTERSVQYNISLACRSAAIGRQTYYDWMNEDPDFKKKYAEVMESRIDAIEQSLFKNINAGDSSCTIFALKTIGKDRGYVERDSVNKKVASLLEDVLADKITAREAAFKINAMGQPLPEVLKLELAKAPAEDPNAGECVSVEELERKAKAAMEAVMQQRDHFVPERREEVKEIKDRLKDQETFGED